MKKPELLAPAGDYACLSAALKAGADAVYIGGQKYGARAYAGNFSDEEVIRALREAHFYGRKIYLTVNTLMKQEELNSLEAFMEPFCEAGLDGVIVQDVGALSLLHRCFPDLLLHASTQMTITDAAGAEVLRKLGVVRVVPARELSLEEVRALKRESGLEVETFIHGAMCYSYSGQCLFSSFLGGRSGNRGRCAQPCRQPCRVSVGKSSEDARECYPLSLKDMCAVEFVPELMEAGVDSFKIEGRMKRPEYVAGVTSAYRRRIDACLAAPGRKPEVGEEDKRILSSLYIRSGICGGYYDRHGGRDMITLTQPGYAGTQEALLERIRREVMDPPQDVPVDMKITLRAGEPVRLGVSTEAERSSHGERMTGEPAPAYDCVELTGERVQKAQKRPLTREDVEKQLRKTGGSGFRSASIALDMEDEIFLPVSALNELRRQALNELRQRRIASHSRPVSHRAVRTAECPEPGLHPDSRSDTGRMGETEPDGERFDAPALHTTVHTAEQLEGCLRCGVSRIYIPFSDLDGRMRKRIERAAKSGRGRTKADGTAEEKRPAKETVPKEGSSLPEFFLSLPVIWREGTCERLAGARELLQSGLFAGAQISSLSGLTWLRRWGFEGKLALDHRIYIWNRETFDFWRPEMDTWCAPLELNRKGIYALPGGRGLPGKELLVYGRIPMMVTANCVRRTMGACTGNDCGRREGKQTAGLTDRYNTRFPVVADCRFGYNMIYNSVPLSLHGYVGEILRNGISMLRLDFLEESGEETERILRTFEDAWHGTCPEVSWPFTTGHFKKGAQ